MDRFNRYTLLALGMLLPSAAMAGKNLAPSVTLTSPASGASYVAPATISLEAAASDTDGAVAQVDFYSGTTLIGSATTAPYAATWSGVAPGSYSLTAKATDNLGATAVSTAVNIAVNAPPANDAPNVNLTAPAHGTLFNAPTAITLSATASDTDGAIARVDFFQGSTLLGSATGEPYTFTWNEAPQGSYTLTAVATDDDGAATPSAAVDITVAPPNEPPLVVLLNSDCAIYEPTSTFTLVAEARDPDGHIVKVDFFANGVPIGSDEKAPLVSLYPLELDVSRYQFAWSNMAAGRYALTAVATDNRGGIATSLPVIVDIVPNAPPSIAMVTPVHGTSFAQNTIVTLEAGADDSDGTVSKVEFYKVYGGLLSYYGVATAPPYRINWTGTTLGSFSFAAKATDNRNKTTLSTPVTVNIIAGNPSMVNLTSPADGATYREPAEITLAADASDPDGAIVKVEFYRGNVLLGTSTVAPYTFTWSSVPAGNYAITAQATDDSGAMSASAPLNITVLPNDPPAVALSAPALPGVSFSAPATLPLRATAVDTDGIAKVEFYRDTTLLATLTAPPYTFDWTNVPPGTYSITADATDSLGAVTTSTPAVITVGPDLGTAPPSVAVTTPVNGARYTAPASFLFAADAADSDGAISQVELFVDGTAYTASAAPYASLWSQITEGSHVLMARATDNAGAVTTSGPVTITVDPSLGTTPPSVTLTRPAPDLTFAAPATVTLTADALDADGAIAQVAFYQGETLLGTVTQAPYTLEWKDIPIGTYHLFAVATDNLGAANSTTAVKLTVTPPALAFTMPMTGQSLTGTEIMVSGTVLAPPNAGVTVNGSVAAVDANNHFHALVPLTAGANTLTATLTTQRGETFTQSIDVTADGIAPEVHISAESLEGIAPLEVVFTATNDGSTDAVVQVGGADPATLLPGATLTFTLTYSTPGTYPVTFTVTDAQSQTSSREFVVVAQDMASVDAKLKAVYTGMIDKLKTGDINGALTSVSGSMHEIYAAIFTALQATLPAVAGQVGTLDSGVLANDMAEYTVLRETPEGPQAFLIYYLRGEDGVWRIEGM